MGSQAEHGTQKNKLFHSQIFAKVSNEVIGRALNLSSTQPLFVESLGTKIGFL
jgi:hypothetical protein